MEESFFKSFKEEREVIRELILTEQFDEAVKRLDFFRSFIFKSDVRSIDLFKFRINSLKKQIGDGLYTDEVARVEKNKQANSLLSFLEDLEGNIRLYLRTKELPSFVEGTLKDRRLEKIVSSLKNIQPLEWMVRAIGIANKVCKIVDGNGNALGTGFLVGKGYLLTCQHVLSSEAAVESARLLFTAKDGDTSRIARISLDPTFCISSHKDSLDYALVKPMVRLSGEEAIDDRGKLKVNTTFKEDGDHNDQPLFMLQHPGGGDMHIAFQSDAVQSMMKSRFLHGLNTQNGSSGSPIFDDEWKVIAMHDGWMPEFGGRPSGNYGTLISAIIQDIHRQFKERGLTDNINW